MNIVVCVKQVPATQKVEVDPVTGVLKRDGIETKMNPYDLYAMETALQIRKKTGAKIHVITMGPPAAKAVLQEAFALGADEGWLLTDRKCAGADVLATSYTIASGIRQIDHVDLILCGKQTTDGDTAQVGPELAEWLGVPSVSNVRKILEIGEDGVSVEMDMPDDVERVRVRFPCLLTVDQDIFQPRLPSYVKKTESAGRPVEILTLDEMEDREETHYGLNGSPTQVQRIFPPAVNDRRELWKEEGEALSDRLYALLRDKKFV